MTLAKADLGIKRVCPSCQARFYDLQKRPIECPKCHFAFEPEALFKQRRTRQPEPVEAVGAAAAVAEEAEDEEIVDLGDDAPEIPAASEDDTFLEEEEEGEADVSGIVGTPGEET